MDGSDDYGFDDFVLDPQALAAIEEAESQFQQSLQAQAQTTPVAQSSNNHVNKRTKTGKGWAPGVGARASTDDFDDLPEVSVRGDGTYGFGGASTRPAPIARQNASTGRGTPTRSVAGNTPESSSRNNSRPRATRLTTTSRPQLQYVAPGRSNATRSAPQNIALQRNDQVQGSDHQQSQINELQKRLDEMRKEHEQAQLALKQAVDAKLMKEGEVSVLRRTIEKNSQSHAAYVAQLKADKEKADTRQALAQKELKAEMERLRTQFQFKQQELEASARKPPMTARSKRVGREFPSTPVAVPPAMSNWHREPSQSTSKRMIEDTPLRPSRPLAPVFKTSPMKSGRQSPVKPRKKLHGFQNAFENTTPMRSPSTKRNKGKAKEEAPIFADSPKIPPPVFSQPLIQEPPSQPVKPSQAFLEPSSSNDFLTNDAPTFDQEMDVITQESVADSMVIDDIEGINWKAELCRIFLTHVHSSGGEVTFQRLLVNSSLISDRDSYSASCGRILSVLANSAKAGDYHESIRITSQNLINILALLYLSKQLESLTFLLDLVAKLIADLPSFTSTLLASESSTSNQMPSTFMDILRMIILEQLTQDKAPVLNSELANAILTLLETISVYFPPNAIASLQHFVREREVVQVFLHHLQPEWFLARSSRLLVLFSTHHELWEYLLGLDQDDDFKHTIIDRLSAIIVDTNVPPVTDCKVNILTFIAQLAISDTEAYDALVASHTLIPSLILYSSHISAPLWDDDDELMTSEARLASVIQILNQLLFLLYHLIFAFDPCVNLGDKIRRAPSRTFNCLNHVFTVVFGRLSYCAPPSWLDEKSSLEMESMGEIARDILELVFDGPEGDAVFSTFHSNEDEDAQPDEDDFMQDP